MQRKALRIFERSNVEESQSRRRIRPLSPPLPTKRGKHVPPGPPPRAPPVLKKRDGLAGAPAKPRKAAVVLGTEEVHLFKTEHPASFRMTREEEDFDWEMFERHETAQVVAARRRCGVLDAEQSDWTSHGGQAFNIFQIPVKLDTRYLSVKELQAELRARQLRVSGKKDQLRARLEAAIAGDKPR
mmetsp:Transcript_30169/g.54251  ORF Transcript_30169/g.54251 Transcript_30169/m.54251 type:complete len:185 (-) Transcript_30169:277-831(-)